MRNNAYTISLSYRTVKTSFVEFTTQFFVIVQLNKSNIFAQLQHLDDCAAYIVGSKVFQQSIMQFMIRRRSKMHDSILQSFKRRHLIILRMENKCHVFSVWHWPSSMIIELLLSMTIEFKFLPLSGKHHAPVDRVWIIN